MSVTGATANIAASRERSIDRLGDLVLRGLCVGAALLGIVVILLIAYQVIDGSTQAISKFGLGFLGHSRWAPNFDVLGAGALLYGTVVSSVMALVLATPLGIAIGLFLALMAPGRVRSVVGPLVEMLAAIPSVILGFWGLLVFAPALQSAEPTIHAVLGWLPFLGSAQTTGLSYFTAGLVLTIMVIPIVASISRDLFLTVPRELQEGAAALGATPWEVIRGVILPTTVSGLASAAVLGLGRALGEAIAVTAVIGGADVLHPHLLQTGDTLASKIAEQFAGVINPLNQSAIFYLASILLVIAILANLAAHAITRRFAATGLVTS